MKKYLILLLIIISCNSGDEVQEMGTFDVTVAGVGMIAGLFLSTLKKGI